jgi:short-subunit dehydrogenase
MKNPKSVLITGAGRGIGAALAREYAAPGIDLFLVDIQADPLEGVCSACDHMGARTWCHVADVSDSDGMEHCIREAEGIGPLDLAVANAGISHGNKIKEETPEEARAVFAVNLDGMLNTILPVLPYFRQRRRGQIALMSSLAGLRGFPHAPSYCATKAAIRVYGQALRARLKREGIVVSVVIPAFVKTPMTDANLYGMPGIVEADKAARIIRTKLAKGKPEFIFPQPYPVLAWILSLVPSRILAGLISFK